ncbi:hypothetical protein GGF42_000976 [Coemansia sp. RSA 2424]|nr:hypothetical protein GGF42_000976 [Coemansia sp. RSA 2424]
MIHGIRGRLKGNFLADIMVTMKRYRSTYSPQPNSYGYWRSKSSDKAASGMMAYMVGQYLTNLQVHTHTIFPTAVCRYIVLWLTKFEGIGNSTAKKCAQGVYKKLVDPTRGCDRVDWAIFGAPLQNIKSVEDKLFNIFSFIHRVEELCGKPVHLVPLYSVRAKYITMDSTGLYELLREQKRLPENVKNIQAFYKRHLTHWRKLFRIRKSHLRLDSMDIVANKSYFNLIVSINSVC